MVRRRTSTLTSPNMHRRLSTTTELSSPNDRHKKTGMEPVLLSSARLFHQTPTERIAIGLPLVGLDTGDDGQHQGGKAQQHE